MTDVKAWFSEEMKKRITHIRQSRGKRLAGTTRRGDVKEKKVKFPIAAKGEAYEITDAISKVKPMNAGRSVVEVEMKDYEATEWVRTPDLAKLGPNEMDTVAQTLANAINRKEDDIQWDATKKFGALTGVRKVGGASQATNPNIFLATKARLRAKGDNGPYNIYCPLPEMAFEQLMVYKQFANAEWRGDSDLPMLHMGDMEVRRYRGVIFFTLPDSYFANGSGVGIDPDLDSPASSFFTYMWADDALGVETNWDKMKPSFTQHADYQGSPYLGKVGLGGAAVGILKEGVARIQLQTLSDITLPA